MGSFIAKQPNGLYCRFSTVVDCITHYNMTKEEYIKYQMDLAKEEAIDIILNHTKPFEWVKERFIDNNMTKDEFEIILKQMKD